MRQNDLGKKDFVLYVQMVGEEGIEPSSLAAHDFESCVFANFTTRPPSVHYHHSARGKAALLQRNLSMLYSMFKAARCQKS